MAHLFLHILMTESRNRNHYVDYPMDFSHPHSEKMRNILDTVGLAGHTVNERQRNYKVRSTLIAKGLLLAMRRPTLAEKSPAYTYLHRAYAQAAFQGMPDLRDYSKSNMWLQQVVPHLQAFAVQDEARHIVGEAIASHYNRIADQTLKLPHSKNDIWIPAYETTDGVDPMGIMGVIARRVTLSPYPHLDTYRDNSDGGRAYYRITSIVPNIGWTVPGIGTEETQASILDTFSATFNPERAVLPQTLFMAGTATVMGAEIPLTEVFGVQNQ